MHITLGKSCSSTVQWTVNHNNLHSDLTPRWNVHALVLQMKESTCLLHVNNHLFVYYCLQLKMYFEVNTYMVYFLFYLYMVIFYEKIWIYIFYILPSHHNSTGSKSCFLWQLSLPYIISIMVAYVLWTMEAKHQHPWYWSSWPGKPMPHMVIVNSLALGRFEWYLIQVIVKLISVIDGWGISCETAIRWMSLDLSDDKSTLVQVMAWCR